MRNSIIYIHPKYTPREIFMIKGSLKNTKTRKQPEHGLIRSPESLVVKLAHIITAHQLIKQTKHVLHESEKASTNHIKTPVEPFIYCEQKLRNPITPFFFFFLFLFLLLLFSQNQTSSRNPETNIQIRKCWEITFSVFYSTQKT